MANDEEVAEFWERTVSVGSRMLGGVAGYVVSWATAMPVMGALAGPFVSSRLERLARDMLKRQLSPRQEERFSLAVVLAVRRIAERREAGEELRSDGFFSGGVGDQRAPADEVTEHALGAAMDAFEERKIPYIANMLANMGFALDVDIAEAHLLLAIARSASYLQFAIMKAIDPASGFGFASRGGGDKPDPPSDLFPLSAELYRLFASGVVEMRIAEADVNSAAFLSPSDADPGLMRFTILGRRLYDLAGIVAMDGADETLGMVTDGMRRLSQYCASTFIDGGEI